MNLPPSSRLGSHEIVSLLGAGGMGEVYRARDTKLNRQVAIKVLPPEYARDADRVARFEREAQAVAALNHPNVAAIYNFEESGDTKYLVLELVEGETLAERISRGTIPISEALAIAGQILEALAVAHERGICHRDLKPANIKLTPDGTVKVLDFGLARFLESSPANPNLTNSPTLSLAGTVPGLILGTAGYMSPEQAKGQTADPRSDIFAFGCILFEMLTARRAFDGDTVSEILASVLKTDVDLTQLPPRLHPRLVELLRRCLEKSPKKRWHAAADVRIEIESIAAQPLAALQAPVLAMTTRPLWRRALPWVAGLVIGTVLAAPAAWTLKPRAASPVVKFEVTLPEGQAFTNSGRRVVALSPDGSKLVYVANRRLYLRDIGALTGRPIQGSEDGGGGVTNPVFSPDGHSIVFWSVSDAALKRIDITGGAPALVVKTAHPLTTSWDSEDRILFTRIGEGVLEVPAIGGEARVIIPIDSSRVASAPQLLPDGRTVLYSVKAVTDGWGRGDVVAQPIGGAPKIVISGASDARYVPAGRVVFASAGLLKSVRFDLSRLEANGDAVTVVEGVARMAIDEGSNQGLAQVVFSSSGVMAFIAGPTDPDASTGSEMALFDAAGTMTPVKLPQAPYFSPRISPDGKSVAYDIDNEKEANIWIYQLSATSAPRRLTFGGRNKHATWSHDGQWVFFQSDRDGDPAIFRQRADGSGAAVRVTRPGKGELHIPQSTSPDGRHLIFAASMTETQRVGCHLEDLNLADGKTSRIEGTESIDPYCEGVLSPDGRWLAFYTRTNRDGIRQAFLQPVPSTGARYLVVQGSGGHPVWTRDGRNVILNITASESRIVAVTTPAIQFGEPRSFSRAGRTEPNPTFSRRSIDTLPDGRIIGVRSRAELADNNRIVVVVNWFDELRRLVPER